MKKFMRGWELRKGIEDAAHKLASAMKLRAVTIAWDATIPTACINKKGTIILCDIADDTIVTAQIFMKYLGFIVHELLHRKYSDFGVTYRNHYIRMLANGLEDARIENAAIAAGLTGNIGDVLSTLINDMVDGVTDWSSPAQFPFVIAAFCRNHTTRKVPVHPVILPIFEQARVRLNDCTNSAQVRDLADWVYDQLAQAIEDQPEDDGDEDGEPSDEPSDQPTDGEPSDGEPSEDGEGEGEGKPTEGGEPKRIKPIDIGDAVNPEPTLDREEGVGGGISWSPSTTLDKDCKHVADEGDARYRTWNLSPVGGAKLRYEVRRLFEMSGIDEYQFNRRHGQLDVGNLHTIPAGNDRVFKRHHEEGGIDSAVVFIMDCSGSMFDENMQAAAPVMATMLDTLDRAGVATSVITFGTTTSMLKPWNMTKAKALPLISRMKSGGDNSDSAALRYAHSLLLNRPEQRKVVFILADGGVSYDDEKRCMSQAKSGERLGITTIGIGIHADLSNMYPNNIVIDKLDQLASASFKQIKLAA
jgi:Mg-chelatase subunit ChlD